MVVPKHKHLIIRAECNKALRAETEVSEFLEDVVNALGMNIASGPHVKYIDQEGNRGCTGIVIIETSHCAIHIWDDQDPYLVQFDVYTCGELVPRIIFDLMYERLDPIKIEYKYLDRENSLIEVTAGTEDSTNPMVTGLDPNTVVG